MTVRPRIAEIEILEDFSPTARCDEGFLHIRRLRCRNVRSDGSHSESYRVDVVDRPRLDAVAVLVYRRVGDGFEALTRQNLRPAAFFRKDKRPTVPDGKSHLLNEEIVAGLLEPADVGVEGLKHRAAAEVWEEAGIRVEPSEIELLGAPFFVAPGILSEKIFLAAADATGRVQASPEGDGSPLEEGGELRWRPIEELLAACRSGEIGDAKTELAATRFLLSR